MDKKQCNSCGAAPHECSCKNKEFTKAVIEIDNPEQITLMRRVVIPASMGDDTAVPPVVGKYHNVLLYYEANHKSYLYSSDGIPTLLANGLTDYEQAVNLPEINGNILIGDKTGEELGLQNTLSVAPDTGIQLENNELSGLPATENTIGMVRSGAGLEIDTDGTLSIIDHVFDTVADMKASTDLANGDYAQTLGFYGANDGGGAIYRLRGVNIGETIDEASIIEMDSGTLVAELIIDSTTNVRQFGAKGNDSDDDSSAFTKYINYCNTHSHNIIVPVGKYRVYQDLPQLDRGVAIVGEPGSNAVQGTSNYKSLILDYRDSTEYLIRYSATSSLGDTGNSIYNISFSNPSGNTLKCINFDHGGYKSEISNVMFSRYQQAMYINTTHATRLNNVNCVRCGDMVNGGTLYAIEVDGTTDVVMDHCMMEHSRFMLNVHNSTNFVLTNSYFELGSPDGYSGDSPIIINGGTITNNYFCTRKVETIASDMNDTIANVYYMVSLKAGAIFANNRLTFGTVSGANDGGNKRQGKYLTTNEMNGLTIVNNEFNNVSFDTPGIYLQGTLTDFSHNRVRITLEVDSSDSLAALYPIYLTGLLQSTNNQYRIDTTKASPKQYEYLPKLSNRNYIEYSLFSTYASGTGYDTYQYNTARPYTNRPTLCIQGDGGLFRLVIRNVQYNAIWYEAIVQYDISGNNTTFNVIETLINKLSSRSINIIKASSEKLIVQTSSSETGDMSLKAEDLITRGFAYTANLEEISDGIIHTIS